RLFKLVPLTHVTMKDALARKGFVEDHKLTRSIVYPNTPRCVRSYPNGGIQGVLPVHGTGADAGARLDPNGMLGRRYIFVALHRASAALAPPARGPPRGPDAPPGPPPRLDGDRGFVGNKQFLSDNRNKLPRECLAISPSPVPHVFLKRSVFARFV